MEDLEVAKHLVTYTFTLPQTSRHLTLLNLNCANNS